ncbi:MAG: hypothetical protein JO147_10565 [Actinobacteria bacterium]|nr:hypothetical protein [Actinomycetota bacterium]
MLTRRAAQTAPRGKFSELPAPGVASAVPVVGPFDPPGQSFATRRILRRLLLLAGGILLAWVVGSLLHGQSARADTVPPAPRATAHPASTALLVAVTDVVDQSAHGVGVQVAPTVNPFIPPAHSSIAPSKSDTASAPRAAGAKATTQSSTQPAPASAPAPSASAAEPTPKVHGILTPVLQVVATTVGDSLRMADELAVPPLVDAVLTPVLDELRGTLAPVVGPLGDQLDSSAGAPTTSSASQLSVPINLLAIAGPAVHDGPGRLAAVGGAAPAPAEDLAAARKPSPPAVPTLPVPAPSIPAAPAPVPAGTELPLPFGIQNATEALTSSRGFAAAWPSLTAPAGAMGDEPAFAPD